MNVFATSNDPVMCARYLDDKRVIKMTLETAQMLSTVTGGPYKPTHQNHPCVRWLRADPVHYTWLVAHFEALCAEYTLRYGKTHKCAQYIPQFRHACTVPYATPTWFADCSNVDDPCDLHTRYRICLDRKWVTDKRRPTFKISA